jgi:hypothetical protein
VKRAVFSESDSLLKRNLILVGGKVVQGNPCNTLPVFTWPVFNRTCTVFNFQRTQASGSSPPTDTAVLLRPHQASLRVTRYPNHATIAGVAESRGRTRSSTVRKISLPIRERFVNLFFSVHDWPLGHALTGPPPFSQREQEFSIPRSVCQQKNEIKNRASFHYRFASASRRCFAARRGSSPSGM